MNRKTIRMAAATAVAALALGVGGGVAQAHSEARTARTAVTSPQERAGIQAAARALLKSDIKYSAADRAELRAMANGDVAFKAGGKLGALVKLLKKVPGFAKAVAGKYNDFKKWYNGLSPWVRYPLAAAGVGSDLYSIWQLFH
ncbi:hypothetical protein GCM10018785_49510 [Streptomyces longispororuber]|uniref:Secreted protein n=1 Tax=Streptomyces longispororuber TaxID=68230 RepID=A0A918ZXG8_9ACTN|nr:hypothetical protein [Streptomyces longispororuber]GHE75227.1 hypothetical protein GCM10018785_49510 [Streptomyces longispororuber]